MKRPGAKVVFPGAPSPWRKNARRIVFHGERCRCCGAGKSASIVPAKLPAKLTAGLPVRPVGGPVMATIAAYWPAMHRTSRAPGQPRGDADAVLSAVLDALSGRLYHDDAQVSVVIGVSCYDKASPRVEATVTPLSPALLAMLEQETGLALTAATLFEGQQEPLL